MRSSFSGGFCRAGVRGLVTAISRLLEAVDILRVISILGVGAAGERPGAERLVPKVPGFSRKIRPWS